MPTVYRLWCPDYTSMDRIVLGTPLDRDENTIVVEIGKLEVAFEKLAQLVKRQGRADRIEFHCHGAAAQLFIAAEPQVVNRGNVLNFGSKLNKSIKPGGMLELLACNVACQNSGKYVRALPHNIQGYHKIYHETLRDWAIKVIKANKKQEELNSVIMKVINAREEQYQKNMVKYDSIDKLAKEATINSENNNNTRKIKISNASSNKEKEEKYPRKHYMPRYEFNPTDAELDKMGFQFDPNLVVSFVPETDGLKFCQELASSSGATVRAGTLVQTEEGDNSVSKVGNWEGPVFDFYSGGRINYLGNSIFRPESWKPGTKPNNKRISYQY